MAMLKGQDILLVLKLLSFPDVEGRGHGGGSGFGCGSADGFGFADGSWADPEAEAPTARRFTPQGLTYAQLGAALGLSPSQVHDAAKRAMKSGLIDRGLRPRRRAVSELLVHGVKYFFPAERGGPARGVPTSYGAEPLSRIIQSDGELPPVWRFAEGTARGMALEPIYKSAPFAALGDPALYEYLALIDAIRSGRAREVTIAIQELECRLEAGQ